MILNISKISMLVLLEIKFYVIEIKMYFTLFVDNVCSLFLHRPKMISSVIYQNADNQVCIGGGWGSG